MTIAAAGVAALEARIDQERAAKPAIPVGAPLSWLLSGEAGRTAGAVVTNRADTEGRRGQELGTLVTQVGDDIGKIGNRRRRSRRDQRERTRSTVLGCMRRRCLIGAATVMHALVVHACMRLL